MEYLKDTKNNKDHIGPISKKTTIYAQEMSFANNEDYKNHLSKTSSALYLKYVADIKKLRKGINNKKFLDVGCGAGNVLKLLGDKDSNFGVDISEFFIKEIREAGYNVESYDGIILPFNNDFFGITGSFTVLEHVSNPALFLDEMIRVTQKNGYIIIACPNFLSIFNNSKHYTLQLKLKKIFRYMMDNSSFLKIKPVFNKKFVSDDDAIVETNLIHISRYLSKKNIQLVSLEGTMTQMDFLGSIISKLPLIKYLLPSCYIIAKKN